MFIPLRTNRPPKRRPVITEGLLLLNMLIFLVGVVGHSQGWFDYEAMLRGGHFRMGDFHFWQLFSYQFLHNAPFLNEGGGFIPWHLFGNMLFLWIFGCAVEDRMTRLGYLLFYLMAGMMAALAHGLVSPAPIIGASGSIAGMTGSFLALFPRSRIRILFIFFIIGVYEIPALWFIGIYFLIDVLRQTGDAMGVSSGHVAYAAHIAGYIYGFSLAVALLATKMIRREEFDVFFLWKQARRRAEFRAVTRTTPGGKHGAAWEMGGVKVKGVPNQKKGEAPDEASPDQQKLIADRQEIGRLIENHDLPAAVALYRNLIENHPKVIFPESRQLDLGNQLYAEKDYSRAARCYETLLARYPRCNKGEEVRLILGLIYTRHIPKHDRARALIAEAKKHLRVEGLIALAGHLEAELKV